MSPRSPSAAYLAQLVALSGVCSSWSPSRTQSYFSRRLFRVIAMSINSDLRYLYEEKLVKEEDVDKLTEMGINSIARLALLEDNRAGVREVIGKVLSLDVNTPDGRGRLISVMDAWETAQRRTDEQRKQDAEAKSARLPRTLPRSTIISLRKAVEEVFGDLPDKIAPGVALIEMVLEQVEEHAIEAIPFTQVFCVEDGEDLKTGATIDTAGVVRIRRGRVDVAMPADSEELRRKLRCWGYAFIYAKLRHPGRAWLKSANQEVICEYCDFLLGDQVYGLVAKDQSDNVVARPKWSQVLHYDFQIRKEMAKHVLKGHDFADALRKAMADPALREHNFVTPLACSAIASATRPRSRSPRGRGQAASGSGGASAKQRNGKGQGKRGSKGKGGSKGEGKGSGKGKGKQWYSKTVDGRAICYAYNNADETCEGACGRVHVCRICFGKHPAYACDKTQ